MAKGPHTVGVVRTLLFMMLTTMWADSAAAQLGALVSPGRLNRAHASLEGVSRCLSCHTAGEQVSASKCLACHVPVADRIRRKGGVHRQVTTDCVTCHVEHAGLDGELRPFDLRQFDHDADTAYPLDGEHARLKQDCAACHKTRSFLAAGSGCASCHADPHKSRLGSACANCHQTSVKFAESRTRFDHSRTAFALTGAHKTVACASCHPNNTYKGVKFDSCANCHTDVHRGRFGPSCSTCHTADAWRTTRVDHTRTDYPLRGKHAAVACAKCHTGPAMKVKPASATCASCHADPHRGLFKQDCRSCHTEAGFKNGTFDHRTTRFPLVDGHAGIACVRCHTGSGAAAVSASRRRSGAPVAPVIDYRGLTTSCQSCHADVHRSELGAACESCHTPRSFAVTPFSHAKDRAFFKGQHAAVACNGCHIATFAPVRVAAREPASRTGFTTTATACVSCHRDVHLGQVGATCERCHDIALPRFQVSGFTHRTTAFSLTGRHEQAACVLCHKVETRDFPAGRGEARHWRGVETACASCHTDVHRKELPQSCERCHTTERFSISTYTHQNTRAPRAFFTGAHAAARCDGCHKPAMTVAGASKPLPSFRTSTTCVNCHTDVHRGALGPRCEGCHRW